MNFPTVARVWWLSHPSVHCFHCYFFFLSFPSLTSHSNCAFWYAIDTTVYLLVKGAGLSWGGLSFLACKFSWRLSSNPRDLCVCLVAQSCPTLHDPIGRTVARQAPLSMEILQTRILQWVAMPSSRGSSQPKDQTQVPCIAGGFFTIWATREAQWPILPSIWDLLQKTQCMQLDNWAKFQGSQLPLDPAHFSFLNSCFPACQLHRSPRVACL